VLPTVASGSAPTRKNESLEENAYATPVRVRMSDGDEVSGVIEYYDQRFIRLTREGQPNLFIFKHDINYLVEEA
jgi:sRNA-binding regulator protein Hfq